MNPDPAPPTLTDPGKTGLELSALNRINELYASKGFRVLSGEGGRPFGLERYVKALYVAWHYKHRVALRDPGATLVELLNAVNDSLKHAEARLSTIDPSQMYAPRTIGRKKLPTTVLGLLVHIAEHTQRHLGQAITTAKLVSGGRS